MTEEELLKELKNLRKWLRREATREQKWSQEFQNVRSRENAYGCYISYEKAANKVYELIRKMARRERA